MTSASDNTPRMTAETVALSIVQDEEIAKAAAALRALSDDDLRQRVRVFVADYDAEDGSDWARTEFDADNMSRDEMIRLLSDDAGGCPPTFGIPADADDPLVLQAQELRRQGWERDVAATIKSMGLTGEAAERHRAVAEEMELNYLRGLVEETWELPEASLRVRVVEIVAKLADGADGPKRFPCDPETLSRGGQLAAIADHLRCLSWAPHLTAAE
jgi:hypothetical protein